MSNLNRPAIKPGPLKAADLDRTTNTGRIHRLHRASMAQCPPCNGQCHQGRTCNAQADQACAVEGGRPADPLPSGAVRRAGPWLGLLLVLLCWLPVVIAAAVLLQIFR